MPLDGKVWTAGGFLAAVEEDDLPAVSLGAVAVIEADDDLSVAAWIFRSVVLLGGLDVVVALVVAGLAGLVGVLTVGVLTARPGDLAEGFVLALTVEMALGALFPALAAIGLCASLLLGAVLAILGRSGMEEVGAVVRDGFAEALEDVSLVAPMATPLERATAGGAGWLEGTFLGVSRAFLSPLGADAGASKVFLGVLDAGSLFVLLGSFANSFLGDGVGDLSLWAALVSKDLLGDLSFWSLSVRTGVGAEIFTSAGGGGFGVASRAGFAGDTGNAAFVGVTGVASSGMGAGIRLGVCTMGAGLESSSLTGDLLLAGERGAAGTAMSDSVPVESVLDSVGIESLLVSRWRPTRPSFSTVTKLVRTRDSGRGESAAGMRLG